ncbi:MAG: hypothetical protein IT388_02800, partial [Nitrospirales bacterium]|nr:hypothetical protein [Nitrospirales bacterium]
MVIRYRYGVAALLFVILVSAKLHGSSLPVWDHFLKMKTDPSEKSLLMGKERDIRSDEWLVQTPMYLSQAESKGHFPVVNPNIRSDGQNMLVSYYAPALDITQIGKPFNWGFLLLGRDYGLSWYWWSKLLLLLLLSYEMCLLLTGRSPFLSALGALWISFSPFIQWWFSTPLVDLIIYTQALVVVACRYVITESRRMRVFLMTILAIGAIGFVLSLYPPFQVPLGYFILLFVMFFFFANRQNIKLGRFDLVLVAAALLLVTGALLSFFVQSKEAIRLMMDTVYPGQRLVTGGGYDMGFLQFYLTNWRLPFHEVNFLNRCELSTFLHFFPAVLFLFFRVYRFDKEGWRLAAALFCFVLFLLSWLFVQYPEWFARYSVFSRVPEHRLQVVISLLALYLSIWMFSLISKHKPVRLFEACIISLFITLFYLYSLKHTPMLGYLPSRYALLTLAFFFLLNCSFLLGRARIFGLLLTLFIVISGMTVNPLSRGTGPLYHKVITQKVLAIEKANPRCTWAVVNSSVMGSYLIALGVKSLNSVHYYPDMKLWKSLDPAGKYVQAYNRYAHISLRIAEKDIRFEVLQPDLFTVFISPEDLRRVGVRYVLSLGRIPVESAILKEIDRVEGD